MTPEPYSPYLTRPRRGLRAACVATWLSRGKRPPCAACTVGDLCERDAGERTRPPMTTPAPRAA